MLTGLVLVLAAIGFAALNRAMDAWDGGSVPVIWATAQFLCALNALVALVGGLVLMAAALLAGGTNG